MFATVPADVIQFYGHAIRIAQKLAYLYGFPDLSKMDDGSNHIYMLFIGIMSGIQSASAGIQVVFRPTATAISKRLAAKPLTKEIIYPITKK